MQNEKIKKIVFCAILIALIAVLVFTGIGFITLTASLSITIIHIVVIIGALVLGYKYGAILGFVFGLCSFILSFFFLATQAPFTNPLVSIIPRIIFGLLIYPIYQGFFKLIKNKTICSVLTSLLATLLHTVIVLTMFYIISKTGFYFGKEDYQYVVSGGVFDLIFAVILSNGLIEIGLATIICPPIFMVLDTIIYKDNEYIE